MKKFDWLASESAPVGYPAQIIKGDFIAPDGSSVYIPSGGIFHHGWGEFSSSHIVGPDKKALPNKMDIIYFSYIDNKFYQGSFDLPYDVIVKAFNSKYLIPQHKKYEAQYRQIIAGVAPGGLVSVWLKGAGSNKQILLDYAKEVDLPWEDVLDNEEISRETFVRNVLDRRKDAEKIVEKSLFEEYPNVWEEFDKTYKWSLKILSDKVLEPEAFVPFFNGESYYMTSKELMLSDSRRLPKVINLFFKKEKGKIYAVELHFDAEELLEAFTSLTEKYPSAKNEGFNIEFSLDENKGISYYTGVRLPEGIARLEKTKFKYFKVKN